MPSKKEMLEILVDWAVSESEQERNRVSTRMAQVIIELLEESQRAGSKTKLRYRVKSFDDLISYFAREGYKICAEGFFKPGGGTCFVPQMLEFCGQELTDVRDVDRFPLRVHGWDWRYEWLEVIK